MSLVSVHNEWDPLEEVIVGTAIGAQIPIPDKGLYAIEFAPLFDDIEQIPSGKCSKRVINETEEDLQELISVLIGLGVTVKRPEPIINRSGFFSTPDWQSNGFGHSYCPRDLFLAIGKTIIEAPMVLRARFFETFSYKDIMVEYLKSGASWISAPKPRLTDDMYNLLDLFKPLCNNEPAFDAANVLRVGKDLLYLISSSGNDLGCQWLKNTLGEEYSVHPCYNLFDYVHIDSTISLLRPGLVLINPTRVNQANLPNILKDWDVIFSPEMVDIGLTEPYSSTTEWIGMNFLMVNPNLAIIDKNQVPLIKILEKYQIDVIPLQLRHARALGGGFHCVTLDTRRKGSLEDYFN